jgi:hypothetical protein
MADVAPAVGAPVNEISLVTSATVTGGDPLEVSGNGTVARVAATNSAKFVGIAAHDAISSARVTVLTPGPVFEGVADGTVTAGDQVMASAVAGKTVKTVPVGAVSAAPTETEIELAVAHARAVIGVALTTAADSATVRWLQR